MTLGDNIIQFYENNWKDDEFYTISDFVKIFDANRHAIRHHLIRMVKKGHLFRIKYERYTWYGKSMHLEVFRRFEIIGVELE